MLPSIAVFTIHWVADSKTLVPGLSYDLLLEGPNVLLAARRVGRILAQRLLRDPEHSSRDGRDDGRETSGRDPMVPQRRPQRSQREALRQKDVSERRAMTFWRQVLMKKVLKVLLILDLNKPKPNPSILSRGMFSMLLLFASSGLSEVMTTLN